jgi:hypothetical protein
MNNISEIDSDFHNFQMKVRIENNKIIKNRSLFCEYSVYSKTSLFRLKLDELFPALVTLPYLNFDITTFGPTLSDQSCDFLEVTKIERKILDSEVEQIGATLAIVNFLGVTDLHKSNMLLGLSNNKMIFAPIDLECFFQHFYSNDSIFLPKTKTHFECCSGVARFLDHLTHYPDDLFFVKLYYGYKKAMSKIMECKETLHGLLLKQAGNMRIPTRVVLKPTGLYSRHLKLGEGYQFIDEEILQLKRNDIPYFFCFLDEPTSVYYWQDKSNYKKVKKLFFKKRTFYNGSLEISLKHSFHFFRELIGLTSILTDRVNLIGSYQGIQLIRKNEHFVILEGNEVNVIHIK